MSLINPFLNLRGNQPQRPLKQINSILKQYPPLAQSAPIHKVFEPKIVTESYYTPNNEELEIKGKEHVVARVISILNNNKSDLNADSDDIIEALFGAPQKKTTGTTTAIVNPLKNIQVVGSDLILTQNNEKYTGSGSVIFITDISIVPNIIFIILFKDTKSGYYQSLGGKLNKNLVATNEKYILAQNASDETYQESKGTFTIERTGIYHDIETETKKKLLS